MHGVLLRRAVALLVGACLAVTTIGCGGSSQSGTSTTPQPGATSPPTTEAARTIEVALFGGQVSGGSRLETVRLGLQVRIRAVSDVDEELHVHTYDQRLALQAGQPGELVLAASIPGRHEVEFEKSGRQALTLEVR